MALIPHFVQYSVGTITGSAVIELDNAISTASGTIPIKFDVNVLDINETIPLADADPKEQQRIIIENIILIKQILQNILNS